MGRVCYGPRCPGTSTTNHRVLLQFLDRSCNICLLRFFALGGFFDFLYERNKEKLEISVIRNGSG